MRTVFDKHPWLGPALFTLLFVAAPLLPGGYVLYIFTLVGLVVALISDLTYMMIDPRIDFESREV